MPKKFIQRETCKKRLHDWSKPNAFRVELIQDKDTGAVYSVRRCRLCSNSYQKKYNKALRDRLKREANERHQDNAGHVRPIKGDGEDVPA